jgi:mannose-1-phosphate guanylyltransferase
LSRQAFPKQFVRLVGEESLFQASARRLSGASFGAPVTVTSDAFRFVVMEQLAAAGMAAAATLVQQVIEMPFDTNLLSRVAFVRNGDSVHLSRNRW